MVDVAAVIAEYRNVKLEGKIIDLIPVSEEILPEIVRLRNQPKSMINFNQAKPLTLEDQKEWFDKYLLRDNDIYWGVYTKDGRFVGTQRLYDIEGDICEQGSTVIDEELAMGAPYIAETILMTTNFAFEKLDIKRLINDTRVDNKNMNSISKKLGYTFIKEHIKLGSPFLYYELTPQDYRKEKLESLIDAWVEMHQ